MKKKEVKVAIVGSRTFNSYDEVVAVMSTFISSNDVTVTEIVSGGAKGADTYAMDFARRHGLKLIVFFPDYKKYDKQAPLIRNKLIVEECDCLLAFWDGQSRGTKFTLDYAIEKGKPIKIVKF